MGKDLAERFPRAGEVFAAVDQALGTSLSRIMWEGPEDELTLTHNAQPAILAHSLAVHSVISDVLQPVAAAGHSLGEYTAYAAAGALALGDVARLVRRRGELMLEAGKARNGTMAAVIGLDLEEVESACQEAGSESDVVVPANMNAPDQTVISGDAAAVERAGERCREAGAKRVLPLNVSGAFHSPLMEPAQRGLQDELSSVEFGEPSFPVVANATAESVTNAETALRLLDMQLTAPVRWVSSIKRLYDDWGGEASFVEVGPGSVLGVLVKRIVPGTKPLSLGKAEQVSQFLEQVA